MKTILITGSTDGIGKQTALELAYSGYKIIIHGRNKERCRDVKEHIQKLTGNPHIDFIAADLGSLQAVREMAEKIKSNYHTLNILINNAGVFNHQRRLTVNGIENTFAVNHLAVFLLTGLLMPLLRESSPTRIINVSSMAHAGSIDFTNLQGEKSYNAYDAYGRSKLCNILFTFELAEKLADKNITVNCLHPGVISTKLLHAGWGMGGASVEIGAQTSVYLATAEEAAKVTGKYFSDRKEAKPASISYDQSVRKKLWKISEKLSGFEFKI